MPPDLSPAHLRPAGVALLALALLVPGCVSVLEGDQPADPTRRSYLLRADSSQKAPHPVSFDGTYTRLSLHGAIRTIEVLGPARASSDVEPAQAQTPYRGPVPSDLASQRLWMQGLDGRFVPDNGTPRNLTDATVVVSIEGGQQLPLPNVTSLRAGEWVFDDDGAHALAPPGPIPTVVPVNVTRNGSGIETEEGAPRPAASYPRMTIGPDGIQLHAERIAIVSDGEQGDGVPNGSQAGPFPGPGQPGTLSLEPGTVAFAGARVAAEPTRPVALAASNPLTRLGIQHADGALTLYEEPKDARDVSLTTRAGSGTIHPSELRAQVTLQTIQWHEDGRPWFEARTEARLEGHGRQANLTVSPGENETLWAAVSEASNVGTAERVEPNLLDPLPPEDTLTVTPGHSWYNTTDPSALEQLGTALGKMITGWFFDPDEVMIDPGETRYIPLYVHAGEDAQPGSYTVELDFKGENARTEAVRVQVQIPSG